MNYLSQFQIWLQTRNYSESTIRNYLVDINKYISWVEKNAVNGSRHNEAALFSHSAIFGYITTTSGQNNYQRYLASINLFCQFASDQNLISQNPFPKIKKEIKNTKITDHKADINNIEIIIKQYQIYLAKKNKSFSTIKNYINDIQQFISWVQSHP